MDTAVIKSNKENSKPEAGVKTVPRCVVSKQKLIKSEPLQSKNDLQEANMAGKVGSKPLIKPATKTNASDSIARKTLSQAFHTQQSTRHRKLVIEVPKPPASVPPKTIPGTYKGRVVKSKIDCFRKPATGDEKTADAQANAARPNPEVRTLSKVRSKSVTTVPGSSKARLPPNLAGRVKSVSDVAQKPVVQTKAPTHSAAKPVTTFIKPPRVPTRPPTASARAPTASSKTAAVPARPATTSSKPAPISKPTSFIKKKEPSVQTKPKLTAAAGDQKTHKPAPSSTSQYRIRAESAEERQAKLAAWLASKGKTLKRPAVTEKAAPRTSKAEVVVKEEAQPQVIPAHQTKPEEVPQSQAVFTSSPSHIINTTLDLLDNSDLDLPADPEIRLESLVVNLCDRLEAMETPSSCDRGEDDEAEMLTEPKVEEGTDKEYEILEEELKEETQEQDGGEDEEKPIKREEKMKKTSEDEEDDDDEMDSTPADAAEGCVVKYSVKTTPFLQSVKKKLDGEMVPGTPGSRRKGGIKELKYLTPVRRSSRIHRYSSRLPDMLNEHDPCVSSLAELELLDAADTNAYIYRKNPALLQHHPQIQNLHELIDEEH
ncbi:cytoskeleton-associated protein 2 [Trichomycterus rosablanca]|uniref:cytoskeleton-associated protein 2 n=1 Tax=Trichomycterus rosablanca TaxID=2290929 RepID=UPI002F35C297